MQSKISKYTVNYFNEEEFHSLKREIFTKDSYYFESENPEPLIIDVGAYIGISVLYFKHIYPNSKIIAFEPNPLAFDMLKENIFINDIKDVELHQSAVWTENGKKSIYIDDTGMDRFSVGSFNKDAWNEEVVSTKLEVNVEKLDMYLDREVDCLKLDVEGSEQAILKGIAKYFGNIRNILVEYHPTSNQSLDTVIDLLKRNYEVEILYEGKPITKNIPKDKLLNIKATCKD